MNTCIPNNKEFKEKIKREQKKKTPETTTEKLIVLMKDFNEEFKNVIVFNNKN